MLIFHLQSKISEFHFPFTCNRGDVLVYRYTHLTSILEIHGSSPGVSNNICLHFIFWPFTVPSPLSIKTRRIANNVINNPIFFIITLFSLNPLSYIIILNRIPEGGAIPLSIMVIWKALFSIASLSLLSLVLLLLLSCSAPLLFWSVSASIYLSSLSPSPSLSLSLLPCVPLILLVCFPLPYSWNLTHG